MDFKNICTCNTYTDKSGNQKKRWLTCGTLKTLDDGRQFIELNHLPNVAFFVFEKKEKVESAKPETVDGEKWDE
jgi:hypothetical protein